MTRFKSCMLRPLSFSNALILTNPNLLQSTNPQKNENSNPNIHPNPIEKDKLEHGSETKRVKIIYKIRKSDI